MKPGDIVRMNAACKRALFKTGSHDHVREFGRCYGVVIGLTDYGNLQGPEWDVRWRPSDLRYAYAEEHLVAVPLKAFYVQYDDLDMNPAVIVYAYTPQEAREIGANDMGADSESCYVHRAWSFEHRAALHTEPSLENDDEYMRALGWHRENEWTCESCGLAAFGIEKYAVCKTCGGCRDCGCEEDCDQSEGFSCE